MVDYMYLYHSTKIDRIYSTTKKANDMGPKRESKRKLQSNKESDSRQGEDEIIINNHTKSIESMRDIASGHKGNEPKLTLSKGIVSNNKFAVIGHADLSKEAQTYITALNAQSPRPMTAATVKKCKLIVSSISSEEAAYVVDAFDNNVAFSMEGIVKKAVLFPEEFHTAEGRRDWMDSYELELEPSGSIFDNASSGAETLKNMIQNEKKLIALVQDKLRNKDEVQVSIRRRPTNFNIAPSPLVLDKEGNIVSTSSDIMHKSVRALFYMSCAFYMGALNVKPRLLLVQELEESKEQASESRVKRQRL